MLESMYINCCRKVRFNKFDKMLNFLFYLNLNETLKNNKKVKYS